MTFRKKLIRSCVSVLTLVFLCFHAYGQHNLMKIVTLTEVKKQPVQHVLEMVADRGDFYFAYNSNTIPADSLVSIGAFKGSVFSLLDKLLGNDYEFKEVPGYIVLRNAPGKFYITAEIESAKGKQAVIKGYVNELPSLKPVARASVYERNQLISAMTNDHGYFELKLKNKDVSVLLKASKENYRDTALYLLPEINIAGKGNDQRYDYYPDNDNGVEHSRFARFFISSRQLMQGINLGNFFASRPYQISLTPGLSTHGMYNSQIIDHFSLNLIGGYTAGIKGLEMAGVFNINRKDVSFIQIAGVFNVVGGNTSGVQMAGVYNNVRSNGSGLQVAGLVNKTTNFKGLQMAGLANSNESMKGLQIAGLVNRTKGEAGAQLSGAVNIAEKVKGFQIGMLLNVADSSDYPLGLINLIKNGEKSFTLSTDESLLHHLDFRSGGRVLYSIIGIGFKPGNIPAKYAYHVGLGGRLIDRRSFTLNLEFVTRSLIDFKKRNDEFNSVRLLNTIRLNRHFRLMAGPTFNFSTTSAEDGMEIKGWKFKERLNNRNQIKTLYGGFTGGLQFVL